SRARRRSPGSGSRCRGRWAGVLKAEEYRVRPLRPWRPPAAAPAARTELPALLRGYLRLGAWVCGEPAHDADFGVADLYVLLPMSRVDQRYLRHFLSLAPAK
ncbi:GNAT family N-acetyltransferase, partial [Streptomyces sp. NPDC007000]